MDNRPIGVFDSGLGGLTAVRELIKALPSEDIIYFGDTGRVPYGTRSNETILKYTRQDVNFLRSFDIKAIVVACGTAGTVALDTVAAEYPIPISGVVLPTSKQAAAVTKNGKIGLIGTSASINSGAYERAIASFNPDARIFSAACPLFVPLVENGRYKKGDIVIETVAAEYLQPLKERGIDTLVLGCTHYPLLEEVVGGFMGSGVGLINSGVEAAKDVAARLGRSGLLAEPGKKGTRRYFVSDRVDGFLSLASVFLNGGMEGAVEKVDIERY